MLAAPRCLWLAASVLVLLLPGARLGHVPSRLDNGSAADPRQDPLPTTQPRGVVRLSERTFADARGPYLAVGASLFWAVWGFQHDRERLEAHLHFLKAQGVDYIRVLGAVGPQGWTGRTANPTMPGYDGAIAGVTDLSYRHGLRVEWTIFGGLDRTETPASRRSLVERFARMAKGREAKIQHWEIANEAWATGWKGREDEARKLARLLQRLVPQPVAVTADGCGTTYYADGAGTLRTAHIGRNTSGKDGAWQPVLSTWEVSSCPPPGAWTSNEPIGPGSSVASDDDPLRLAMAAAMTWLSGGAGYVAHTRPGVRGGGKEDVEKYGGPASIWEVRNIVAALSGIRVVRSLLPPDLPNWRRGECTEAVPNRPFDCSGPGRAYWASKGRDIVCLPLVISGTFQLTARSPITGEWFDPLSGKPLGRFDLKAGERVALAGREAVVVKARWR